MKRGKWLYLILLSFFILMDGYLLIYNTRYRLILSKAVNTNNVSFNSDVNVSHTILTMNDIYENVGLQFRGGLLRDILNHEKISTDFILDASILHYTTSTDYEVLDRSKTYSFYLMNE